MRLFVEQLTVMDFSYLHPMRGLLGESWYVDVLLQGGLDAQGMVLDFSAVKRKVKQLIDEQFDHKLLVPGNREGVLITKKQVRFPFQNSCFIEHKGSDSACQVIAAEAITPETVSQAIETALLQVLPDNIQHVGITLHPESVTGNSYQYSHGLKQHDGNCQRIAHGHRSQIKIFRNDERDTPLEKQWAKQFKDIYIGNREDLQQQQTIDGLDYYTFAYQAEQGLFELTLPASCCYLMATDSTVENIAAHIAHEIANVFPADKIEVHAFEGIGKGAITQIPT